MKKNQVIMRNTTTKECTDCGSTINQIQEAYFNQCEKCLRHSTYE
ncbi:protein YhfH [Bacillus sp. FJAT-45037]|nr:protein YhfH [Bacillus sp. FJAT-45037]